MRSLKQIVEYAKDQDWCLDYLCTTCGARDFRLKIKSLFDRTSLLEEMRKLDSDFTTNVLNRSAMLILLDDLNQTDYSQLIRELAGTASGDFLNKAISIRKERVANHRNRMLLQEQDKKKKLFDRAWKNIWGAIDRNDSAAINCLLSTGLNLDQQNINGKSIRTALLEKGMKV